MSHVSRSSIIVSMGLLALAFPCAALAEEVPVKSGLAMWLAADHIENTADGESIATWTDLSGIGHDAVSISAGDSPVFKENQLNGKPVLRFDGQGDSMRVSGFASTTNMTIFTVVKASSYQSLLRWQGASGGFFVYHWNNLLISSSNGGTAEGPEAGLRTGLAQNRWNIGEAVIDTADTQTASTFTNGAPVATSVWRNNPNGGPDLYIGRYFQGSEFYNGDIAEIIVYSRALSTSERGLVGSYLQRKYALPGAYSSFLVSNSVNGNTDFIGASPAHIVDFPISPSFDEYQITFGAGSSADPAGWLEMPAAVGDLPAIAFTPPMVDGPITFRAWVRSSEDPVDSIVSMSYTIEYCTVPPVALAHDASLEIDPVNGTPVPASAIDEGSYDSASGIHSMWVTPASITAPGTVTLHVQNNAGITATTTAQIAPAFWCTFEAEGATSGAHSLEAAFNGIAYGSAAATATVFYAWNFGDGSPLVEGEGLTTVGHDFTEPGSYTVRLSVSNLLGNTANAVRTGYITVYGARLYADAESGTGSYPYATPGTASPDLQAVVSAAREIAATGLPGVIVEVAPGTYDLDAELLLDEPITVMGTGTREETLVRRAATAPDLVRVAHLTDTNAVLAGVTLCNGAMKQPPNTDQYTFGAGLCIEQGIVTNCVIRDNSGSTLHGGNYVRGAGVYLAGGELVDSLISGNGTNSNFQAGGGVFMVGGILRRCVVSQNSAGYSSTWQKGMDGGGGLYMSGGLAEGCLFTGNEVRNYDGGGVLMDGGELVNCTVSGNEVRSGGTATGAGVRRRHGGTVRSCIVYGNVNGSGLANNFVGSSATHSCAPELTSGTGNIAADPRFVDAANGDFHISAVSPCIDLAAATTATLDLDGNARVVDGDGDGVATPDMGCYEYFRPADVFGCSFVATNATAGIGSLDVSFAAVLYGSPAQTSSVSCTWDFGDGSPAAVGANLLSVDHSYTSIGQYDVTLTVENADDEPVTFFRPGYITVYGSTVYIATNSIPSCPYATPATAAADVTDGFAAAIAAVDAGATAMTVEISEGSYAIGAQLAFTRPIRMVGVDGPEVTEIVQTAGDSRLVFLDDPGAMLSGVTLRNGFLLNDRYGAGARVEQGVITNCVITGCNGGGHARGCLYGSLYVANSGLAVDTLVISNRYEYNAAAVWVVGGTVDRCEIAWNRNSMQHHSGDGGAGVRMSGGTVRNSLVRHNTSIYHNGGGARIYGGTFENCTVVDNNVEKQTDPGYGGGVFQQGGTVRNCIVVRNEVGGNASDYVASGTPACEHNCAPELAGAGNGNIDVAPLFRDAENGDYRILSASPTAGAGANQAWMASALDFARQPRILGGRVDMGCYEAAPVGTLVLLR
jgi:PKD repeat protein